MINKILCKMWGHGKTYKMFAPNRPYQPANTFNPIHERCIHCDHLISVTIPKGYTVDGDGFSRLIRDHFRLMP